EISAEADKGGAASLRVIADHARAATFLIGDGVVPSNEGRGYVLRKIMRRAIRHGRLLGKRDPFFYQLAATVVGLMKGAYPELEDSVVRISNTMKGEEIRFARALDLGMSRLDSDVATF